MQPSPKQSAARESSYAAVWGPWLAAPLFALLPIAGCGLAGGMPTAVARTPRVRTVPATPVVTVVMADDRQVAWKPAAN